MSIPIIANKWLELSQFKNGYSVSFATTATMPNHYGERHLLCAEEHITSMNLPILSADFVQAAEAADLKPWVLERRLSQDGQIYPLLSIVRKNVGDAAPIKQKKSEDLYRDKTALCCLTTNMGKVAFPIEFDRMVAAFARARRSHATVHITLDDNGFDATLTLAAADYKPVKRAVPLGSLMNPR